MSKIEWNDALEIDLPHIDEQHKKLIAMSNSLIQAMIVGQGKAVMEELFTELKEYTEYHFADEEKLMASIEYPDLDAHKGFHADLIEQVVDFSGRMDKLQPDEALDFLNGWIVKHIQSEDVKVSLHAKNR